MENLSYSFDRALQYVIAIFLAGCGGLARILHTKDSKKLHWQYLLSELFVSGFAGLMMMMFVSEMGLSGHYLGLICGIAGWCGAQVLDALIQPLENLLKISRGKDKDVNP